MDEGFNDRVDKVFGSISSSSSWSLSDAQLERREWKRVDRDDDDDQIPVSSSFHSDDWDIRSSIGLDPTLDNEEEEDAYDKMAEGRVNMGERLYMKDVNDHAPYLSSHNLLKPILKRKTCDDDVAKPHPAKRVSFHSTCKHADAPAHHGFQVSETGGRGVPDYILNPSKYTRYTFDDGGSHRDAYLELLEEINKRSSEHEHKSCGEEVPKSVVFIPRKKRGEEHVKRSSDTRACSAIGIAAVVDEVQEEVDVCTEATCQKPLRRYRSKMEEYNDDDDDVC